MDWIRRSIWGEPKKVDKVQEFKNTLREGQEKLGDLSASVTNTISEGQEDIAELKEDLSELKEDLEELKSAWTPSALKKRYDATVETVDFRTKEVAIAFIAGVGIGLVATKLRQPFRRCLTVDDIPNRYFQTEATIRGRVVKVNDGDTFRIHHKPLFRSAGSYEGKLSENTMQIRLCAIDTPETAKFGNEGQAYGEEAKKWLADKIDGKVVSVQLLQKDQYSRAVGKVTYGMWPFRKDASEQILKAGLAYVYRQSGGVYAGKREKYDAIEAKAKGNEIGVWSQGEDMETAAEYKARTRA